MCEGNRNQIDFLTFVVIKPFITYLHVAVLFSASVVV